MKNPQPYLETPYLIDRAKDGEVWAGRTLWSEIASHICDGTVTAKELAIVAEALSNVLHHQESPSGIARALYLLGDPNRPRLPWVIEQAIAQDVLNAFTEARKQGCKLSNDEAFEQVAAARPKNKLTAGKVKDIWMRWRGGNSKRKIWGIRKTPKK